MGMPNILIVREPVSLAELEPLKYWHRMLVKGVADVERKIIALGGDWHMDANAALIADGSEQKSLWGFNIYPSKHGDEAIRYESLINIRPGQGNMKLALMDENLRRSVCDVVRKLVPDLDL